MSTFNFTKFRYFDGNGHELPLVYGGDIELRIKNVENPKNFTSYLLVTSSPDASINLSSAAMNTSLFKMITGSKYDMNDETNVIYIDSSINGNIINSNMELMNTDNNHFFDVNEYASSNGIEYYPEIVYNEIPSPTKEVFLSVMEIDSSILKFPSLTFNTKINFNRVSTGLVETQTIYILTETEDAYNSEYGLHGMVDVSTYADIEAGKGNMDPTDYINRFQLMFFIDCRKQKDFRFFTLDGDSVVWSDRHFVDFRDGRIDLTFKNGFRVDVGFVGEEEGVYEQDMYVCIIDTSTAQQGYPGDSYPIGVIHMTAETEGKDERYDTLFTNFGIPKIDTFDDVFKDSEVFNDSPDYISMNKHAKKVFLTYSEIFPYVGTYKALFNAVKMLGYDDIFFKEWYKDIGNDISEDNGYITYVIDPSSAIIPSQMYGSTIDERIHIKKMNWISMMYRINEELDVPDDMWGFPTSVPNINYYNTGSIVKLISLKKWLEKYITGVNCRITDISGEGVVFERYALAKYGSYQQVLEYNNERPVGLKVLNETEVLKDCSANIHVALKTADSDLRLESFGNQRFIDFCVGHFDASYYYHEGSGDEIDDSSIIYFSRCMDMNDNMNTFELRANGVHETFRFENDGSILSTHGPSLIVDDNEIFFDPHDSARPSSEYLNRYSRQRNSAFVSLPVIIEYTKDYINEKTTPKTYIPPYCESGNTNGAIKIDASNDISSYTVKKRILSDDSSCVATIYKTTDGSYGESGVTLAVNEQRTYGLRFCIDKNGTPCFRTLYYTCTENDEGDIDGSDTTIPNNRKYEKYLKLGYPIDSSYMNTSDGYFYCEKKDVNGHLIFNDPKHNRRIILIIDYDRENDERKIHVETITYSDVFTLFRYCISPYLNQYVNRFSHGRNYLYFCALYLNPDTIDSAIQYNGDDIPINVLNNGTYTIEAIMMDEYNNMFGVTSSKIVNVLSPEIGIKIFAHDEHSNNQRNDDGILVNDSFVWGIERGEYISGENRTPIYKYVPKYQIADASCFYDGYIKLDSSNTIEERYMKKTSMCEISDLTYRVKYYGYYNNHYAIFTDEHKEDDDVYGIKFAKTDNDVSTCISIDVSTSVTYDSPDSSILDAFAEHYYESSTGTLLDMTLVSYDNVSNTPLFAVPCIVKSCSSLGMYVVREVGQNHISGYLTVNGNKNYDYYLLPSWAIKVNNDESDVNNILYDSSFPFDCSIFDNNVMKLAFTDSSYYGYRSIRCKSLDDGSGLKTDASMYIDDDCSLYLLPKEWNYNSRVFNLDSSTDIKEKNIYLENSAANRNYLYYVDGTNAVSFRDFDINYATSFINTDDALDVNISIYQYDNTIRTHYNEVALAVDASGVINLPYDQSVGNFTPMWKLYTHDNDTTRKLLIESFNRILAIKPIELSAYDVEMALFDRHGNKYEKTINGAFGKLNLNFVYYTLNFGTLPPSQENNWILNNTYIQFNQFDSNTYTGFLALKESVTEIDSDNPFNNNANLIRIDLLNADSVTTIGDNAFEGCTLLKEIVLPESLEIIGDSAFAGCEALREIVLSESLEVIRDNAFMGCTSLECVEFPNSLTTIGNKAFLNCNKLECIELSESITSIGERAFNNCPILNTVLCDALTPPQLGNDNFDSSVDRLIVLYDYMNLYQNDENWSSSFSSIEAFRVEYECVQPVRNTWINSQEWITYSTYSYDNNIGVLYLKHRMDDFDGLDGLGPNYFKLDLGNSFVKNINRTIVYNHANYIIGIVLPHTVKFIKDVFHNGYSPSLNYVRFNGSIKQWCDISFYNLYSNPLQYTKTFIRGYNGEYSGNELVFTDNIKEIKPYAFYRATMIRYIKHDTSSYGFPSSIEKIGSKAFYFDYNLSIDSVIIPETTEEISGDAFYNVKHIIKENDNTNVTWGALYKNGYMIDSIVYDNNNCENIYAADTSISGYIPIDTSVKCIYRYAFFGCDDITTIDISTFIFGTNVILEYAFGDRNKGRSVMSITVEDSTPGSYYNMCNSHIAYHPHPENWGAVNRNIQIVGDIMYSSDGTRLIQCTNQSIDSSVEVLLGCLTIEDNAFAGCSSLPSIIFDSSLTSIGSGAFSGCSSLESITIPQSVTSIRSGAFSGCSSLESITIPFVGYQIDYDGYFGSIFGSASYDGGVRCGSYYIPSTLEHVIINSVGSNIRSRSFRDCITIKTVEIDGSIGFVGGEAFRGCRNLSEILFNVNDCSVGFGDFTSYRTPFLDCSTSISLTFGDDVEKIRGGAFKNFNGLTSLTINERCINMGNDTFDNCTDLTTINFNAINCGMSGFGGNQSITTIEIGDSVEKIPINFAIGCTGLTSINIPDSVTTISISAFSGCTGLTSINIPNRVNIIQSYAFNGCVGLTEVTIGEGISEIWNNAFRDCSSLRTVTFNAINCSVMGGTDYNRCVFYGCNIETINFGNGVTNIPSMAFTSGYSSINDKLTQLIIPDSVETIGDDAFSYNISLSDVSIGNSINEIGRVTFYRCDALSDITITRDDTLPTKDLYGGEKYDGHVDPDEGIIPYPYVTLHVPQSMLISYQNDNNWSTAFPSIVPINNS